MDLTSGSTWAVLYLISEWLIRLGMLIVVPFRRSPEAAKGWLLLVFFLPWPALVLYFLIGRPTYPRWRHERFLRLPGVLEPVRTRLAQSPHIFRPELPHGLAQAATLVENLGQLTTRGGNHVELLADYGGVIDRLVSDIQQARDHVHLLYYIFADDPTGRRVAAALAEAVKRGGKGRVFIASLGSRRWAGSMIRQLRLAGVHVERVLPVHFLRRQSARADLRNHRKIAVIDGRIGYTGSQNLVDPDFKPGITYEELVVRVTGPVVLGLQFVFVADWYLESDQLLDTPAVFPGPDVTGDVPAQPLPSGPGWAPAAIQRVVVALIHGARERVVITTPYFIPDGALLQALQTAVLRGVEVHLVVSKQPDQLLVSLAQKSYYQQLLESGVHVHLYHKAFLHAKHVSIDDEVALIGSSNMDIRSFLLNAE